MSGFANAVIPFAGDTPIDIIRAIPIDVIIRGEDQQIEDLSWPIEFVRIPRLHGYSTTQILQAPTLQEYERHATP